MADDIFELLGIEIEKDPIPTQMEQVCHWLGVDETVVEAFMEAEGISLQEMYLSAKEVRPRALDEPEDKLARGQLRHSVLRHRRA